jgi:hypothetical protein
MATYDLGIGLGSGDSLQTLTPYWVVGICRFANPVTWDPTTRSSISDDDDFALQEREPLVLSSSVINLTVSAAKESHVTNLNMTCIPDRDYLSEIMTGDWVVCCLVSGDDKGLEIEQKMIALEPVNKWSDGLKFIGKVKSNRKRIERDRGTGQLHVQYSIQAVGFGEFDTQLFYHPQLERDQITPASLHEFGILVKDIVTGSDDSINGGTVDINKILPKISQTVFGKGAWADTLQDRLGDKSKLISGFDRATGKEPDVSRIPPSPNSRYLVPETIMRWLGVKGNTFSDLLSILIGLQHYQDTKNVNQSTTKEPWGMFLPDGLRSDSGVLRTSSPLMGWFPLNPPNTNVAVWSFLSSYMNAPLNEMYVALRGSPGGDILPTLVIRQLPYSTSGVKGVLAAHQAEFNSWADAQDEIVNRPVYVGKVKGRHTFKASDKTPYRPTIRSAEATEFLELPRWVIPPSIIYMVDIGRSDALRFNMVHVSGTGQGVPVDENGNFVRAAPVQDNLDIKRNGLHPYMPSINCMLKDLTRGPRIWRDLMADVVMGQHLTLTGQITCRGIVEPVAPGDNVELEGVVFHVESITHTASIGNDGSRSFQTVMALSHGVEGEWGEAKNWEAGADDRTAHFAGVEYTGEDLMGFGNSAIPERDR